MFKVSRTVGAACRLAADAKGNTVITFALTLMPVVMITGMAIDYTIAGRREVQLNAIADAAALSTTTPSAMALASTVAQANALTMFNAQAAKVGNATLSAAGPQVIVTDTVAANGAKSRTTSVTYAAASTNAFGGLLKFVTFPIGGTAQASISTAPNIDFYMLVDTSPSMAIPSSVAGINTMVAATPQQGGCAFACHESNPTPQDVAGNPGGVDNYTLARSLGVTLRIDLIKQATANLISTAISTSATNKAAYRVATYTFDAAFNQVTALTSNLAQAQSDASTKINMLVVANDQGYLTPNNFNNDEDTQWDQAMQYAQYLPTPGNGTNAAGDTPQEVLFIVTDGVADEAYPNVGNTFYTDGSGRTVAPMGYQNDWCTPIKNRNIRIAILYTTYYPLPSNAFYNTRVEPYQPAISSSLQACASTGLFFQVDTGGDINAAMQALFAKAVSSAHLTQ